MVPHSHVAYDANDETESRSRPDGKNPGRIRYRKNIRDISGIKNYTVQVRNRTNSNKALICPENETEMEHVLVIGAHVQNGHPLSETPVSV